MGNFCGNVGKQSVSLLFTPYYYWLWLFWFQVDYWQVKVWRGRGEGAILNIECEFSTYSSLNITVFLKIWWWLLEGKWRRFACHFSYLRLTVPITYEECVVSWVRISSTKARNPGKWLTLQLQFWWMHGAALEKRSAFFAFFRTFIFHVNSFSQSQVEFKRRNFKRQYRRIVYDMIVDGCKSKSCDSITGSLSGLRNHNLPLYSIFGSKDKGSFEQMLFSFTAQHFVPKPLLISSICTCFD